MTAADFTPHRGGAIMTAPTTAPIYSALRGDGWNITRRYKTQDTAEHWMHELYGQGEEWRNPDDYHYQVAYDDTSYPKPADLGLANSRWVIVYKYTGD